MENKKTIAVFDFDGTLVRGDSLWPFLLAAVGWRKCVFALGSALREYVSSKEKDKRTLVKKILLEKTLAGLTSDDLRRASKRMRSWPVWKEKTLQYLKEHHANGDHIVIASGSLDIYLPELLEGIPYDGLICTAVESKDGICTGKMPSGNCVRERKAELVKEYIVRAGGFDSSWGYGNLPHDLPMLELMDNRVVV